MNSANSLSFRLNLALLVVMVLLVSTVSSLALVHLRVEIEQTAERMRNKERQVKEMERKDRFLDARIAHVQQPRELRMLMAEQGLDLRPSQPAQVVHVHRGSIREEGLLAGNVNSGADRDAGRRERPFSLNIAVLQQQPGTARNAP